ncbi:MAG: hypothetical protein IMX02_09330 [Limnochordaceae bacterium]|uniref:Uncharacterized protein n=1 Tax=Carboxydichorda subterranea TaxID=3109565 RepID=A0ABZ1BYU3_9FIRM|nr:hypothetical protein [Limnochorda sp. L945t]MBE3598971.1 hypothetical protein [Limnochordaceae bacterium]WRP17775.1 hypothetical protein U7230_01835 [Limnochorda sp. L945t]
MAHWGEAWMPWMTWLAVGTVGVTGAGYALSWYRTRAARRRFHFVTRRDRRQLEIWRTAFLIGVLGTVAGLAAAVLSTLVTL